MRVLVYGMQSSGATAFTLFLAQRPECLGLVDILNNYAAPRLDFDGDVVAKVVVTTAYPLHVHQQRFLPDRTILFLRDPRANFESLRRKSYRNHSGLIDEKFGLIDQVFGQRDTFDAVVHYEDFVGRAPQILKAVNALGWPVDESFYAFRRNHESLASALWQAEPDLFDRFEFSYGNVQASEVSRHFGVRDFPAETESHLSKLCPHLLHYYRQRTAQPHRALSGAEPIQAGYSHAQNSVR